MMPFPRHLRLRTKLALVLCAATSAVLAPPAAATLSGGDPLALWAAAAVAALVTLSAVGTLAFEVSTGLRALGDAAARLSAPHTPPADAAARTGGFEDILRALDAARARTASLEDRAAEAEAANAILTARADGVAIAARQATTAVSQVSEGAQIQHDDLDLMATAIGQSAQAIATVTDSTHTVSEMVKAATGFTARGKDEMARLLRLAETIAENSRRIGRITEAITQIAVKTNILSVNASIEAARAGEQGKGFEVVAEEVGKLADNAVESARQIREIVETAGSLAEESKTATGTVVRMMDDIADRVAQVDRMFHSIAVAMEEQQSTMKDIQANVTNIRLVASGNAEASDRIASTMAELVRAAEQARGGTTAVRVG